MKLSALIMLFYGSLSSANTISCVSATGETVLVSRAANLQSNKGWIKANEKWFLGLYTVQETCRDRQTYFAYRPESKVIRFFQCDNGRLFADSFERDTLSCP